MLLFVKILFFFIVILLTPLAFGDEYHCSFETREHKFFTILKKDRKQFIEVGYPELNLDLVHEDNEVIMLSGIAKYADGSETNLVSHVIRKSDLVSQSVFMSATPYSAAETHYTGSCKQETNTIKDPFIKDLNDYIFCFSNKNYRCLASYFHPEITREMGSLAEFINTMESALEELKSGGLQQDLSSLKFGKVNLYLGGENYVAVIPTEMSVMFKGKSGKTNSYIIAVSADDGKTWYYIDGSSKEGKELLEKEAPSIYEFLNYGNLFPDTNLIIGNRIHQFGS